MRAIAMKFTQENWDSIEPILSSNARNFQYFDGSISYYPYLITNYDGRIGCIGNTDIKEYYGRTVYETWDKNIFLEACDIKVEDNDDSFILPQTWYVEVDKENVDVLSEWRFGNNYEKLDIGKITGMYDWGKGTGWQSGIKKEHNYTANRNWENKITFEQFKKYVLKQEDNMNNNKDNRFPFNLNPKQAQQIIDIACQTWQSKLAGKWATNIVMNKITIIEESFYKEMRKACTSEQNQLFDTIFGKDVPQHNYKSGDLVWVRDRVGESWALRFTNGEVQSDGQIMCFENQQKSGLALTPWKFHHPATGVTLPALY